MRMMVWVVALSIGVALPVAAQDRGQASDSQTAASEAGQAGLAPEPLAITRLINWFDRQVNQSGGPKNGFFPELGNMVTGSGWISAGPGYRQHLLDDRVVVTGSAAVSWKFYKMAQVRVDVPHLANDYLSVGSQVLYQDMLQVNNFGVGNNSLKANRSGYRLDETDVLGYATVHATDWLSISGRFGWIHQAELSTMTGWSVSYPNTLSLFTDATAPGLTRQPAFLHGDVSIAADTRNYPGHPTSGGLYRATAAAYADQDYDAYSFRRYELEGMHFLPIVQDNWVIALRGWAVFSHTSGSNVVPFYLMPSLGGKNTLRGYRDYRFHDRDMEVFNAESRWGLFTHLDAAVFFDAGKVAPRPGDLDFSHFHTSYGAGLRVHTRESTVGRLDVGHSPEGWRVVFKLNDPFKRSTLSGGRTEVIPFVP
jgi:hypothetical protein